MVFQNQFYEQIKEYLDKYLFGFDKSQLQCSILNGAIQLENVNIKPNKAEKILQQANLPFALKAGTVGKLEFKFNLLSMFSKNENAISLTINEAFFIFGPSLRLQSNDDSYLEEKEEEIGQPYDESNAFNIFQNSLKLRKKEKQSFKNRQKVNSESKQKADQRTKEGKLLTQEQKDMFKGLKVTVNKFHLRYEDDFYSVSNPYSFGVAFDNVKLDSISEPFLIFQNLAENAQNERQKDSNFDKNNRIWLQKLLKVENLRIYFNCMSEMYIPTSLWEQTRHLKYQIFEAIDAQHINSLMGQIFDPEYQNLFQLILSPLEIQSQFQSQEILDIKAQQDKNQDQQYHNIFAIKTSEIEVSVSPYELQNICHFVERIQISFMLKDLKQYRPHRKPITELPKHLQSKASMKRKRKLIVRDWFFFVVWYLRLKKIVSALNQRDPSHSSNLGVLCAELLPEVLKGNLSTEEIKYRVNTHMKNLMKSKQNQSQFTIQARIQNFKVKLHQKHLFESIPQQLCPAVELKFDNVAFDVIQKSHRDTNQFTFGLQTQVQELEIATFTDRNISQISQKTPQNKLSKIPLKFTKIVSQSNKIQQNNNLNAQQVNKDMQQNRNVQRLDYHSRLASGRVAEYTNSQILTTCEYQAPFDENKMAVLKSQNQHNLANKNSKDIKHLNYEKTPPDFVNPSRFLFSESQMPQKLETQSKNSYPQKNRGQILGLKQLKSDNFDNNQRLEFSSYQTNNQFNRQKPPTNTLKRSQSKDSLVQNVIQSVQNLFGGAKKEESTANMAEANTLVYQKDSAKSKDHENFMSVEKYEIENEYQIHKVRQAKLKTKSFQKNDQNAMKSQRKLQLGPKNSQMIPSIATTLQSTTKNKSIRSPKLENVLDVQNRNLLLNSQQRLLQRQTSGPLLTEQDAFEFKNRKGGATGLGINHHQLPINDNISLKFGLKSPKNDFHNMTRTLDEDSDPLPDDERDLLQHSQHQITNPTVQQLQQQSQDHFYGQQPTFDKKQAAIAQQRPPLLKNKKQFLQRTKTSQNDYYINSQLQDQISTKTKQSSTLGRLLTQKGSSSTVANVVVNSTNITATTFVAPQSQNVSRRGSMALDKQLGQHLQAPHPMMMNYEARKSPNQFNLMQVLSNGNNGQGIVSGNRVVQSLEPGQTRPQWQQQASNYHQIEEQEVQFDDRCSYLPIKLADSENRQVRETLLKIGYNSGQKGAKSALKTSLQTQYLISDQEIIPNVDYQSHSEIGTIEITYSNKSLKRVIELLVECKENAPSFKNIDISFGLLLNQQGQQTLIDAKSRLRQLLLIQNLQKLSQVNFDEFSETRKDQLEIIQNIFNKISIDFNLDGERIYVSCFADESDQPDHLSRFVTPPLQASLTKQRTNSVKHSEACYQMFGFYFQHSGNIDLISRFIQSMSTQVSLICSSDHLMKSYRLYIRIAEDLRNKEDNKRRIMKLAFQRAEMQNIAETQRAIDSQNKPRGEFQDTNFIRAQQKVGINFDKNNGLSPLGQENFTGKPYNSSIRKLMEETLQASGSKGMVGNNLKLLGLPSKQLNKNDHDSDEPDEIKPDDDDIDESKSNNFDQNVLDQQIDLEFDLGRVSSKILLRKEESQIEQYAQKVLKSTGKMIVDDETPKMIEKEYSTEKQTSQKDYQNTLATTCPFSLVQGIEMVKEEQSFNKISNPIIPAAQKSSKQSIVVLDQRKNGKSVKDKLCKAEVGMIKNDQNLNDSGLDIGENFRPSNVGGLVQIPHDFNGSHSRKIKHHNYGISADQQTHPINPIPDSFKSDQYDQNDDDSDEFETEPLNDLNIDKSPHISFQKSRPSEICLSEGQVDQPINSCQYGMKNSAEQQQSSIQLKDWERNGMSGGIGGIISASHCEMPVLVKSENQKKYISEKLHGIDSQFYQQSMKRIQAAQQLSTVQFKSYSGLELALSHKSSDQTAGGEESNQNQESTSFMDKQKKSELQNCRQQTEQESQHQINTRISNNQKVDSNCDQKQRNSDEETPYRSQKQLSEAIKSIKGQTPIKLKLDC